MLELPHEILICRIIFGAILVLPQLLCPFWVKVCHILISLKESFVGLSAHFDHSSLLFVFRLWWCHSHHDFFSGGICGLACLYISFLFELFHSFGQDAGLIQSCLELEIELLRLLNFAFSLTMHHDKAGVCELLRRVFAFLDSCLVIYQSMLLFNCLLLLVCFIITAKFWVDW